MALKDQPYIPLYVRDVLTDEKLIECSAVAHGVYFRLLCMLHKQEIYGLLCLKQKYKQSADKVDCFADMLSRQMPFRKDIIEVGLRELIEEKVLTLDGDDLYQKRMVKDGELSLKRAEIGKKGGSIVTKQYGKPGFLYLMSDGEYKHKIGISSNPQNRLYRLRSDLKLPKHFSIIKQIPVNDMGQAEDNAHSFFNVKMDGEWVKDSYTNVLKDFALFEAKNQANAENANENEIANADEYDNDIVGEE